jgi:hypothetical protein
MAHTVKGEIKKVERFNKPFSELWFTALTLESTGKDYAVATYEITDEINPTGRDENLTLQEAQQRFLEKKAGLLNLGYEPREV